MSKSKKEKMRQAKTLLKKLARSGAFIKVEKSAVLGQARQYCLVCPASLSGKSQQLAAPLVENLLSLEWITQKEQSFVLSGVGKSALRRSLCGGDDFINQHQSHKSENRQVDGDKISVKVSGQETPLAWLARRKDKSGNPMIGEEQFRAGLRFEQDFYFAGLQPNITANWSPTAGAGGKSRKKGMSGGAETPDHILAAKNRLRKTMKFLGSEMGTVVLDVCCFHMGLGQLEISRNWPRRSGKVVLQLALDRLAEHYGLLLPPDAVRDSRPLNSWGAEGYRPKET